MKQKELIIIGAGPIGLACALQAKAAGIDYLILEKGALVNSLYNYPLFMHFFSTAERLEIGGLPFPCTQAKPGRQEAIEYYRRVAQSQNLQLRLFTEVKEVLPLKNTEGFQIICSQQKSYTTRWVIVATGFYGLPKKLNVPGEELAKVHHYYKEPHPFAFQKVAVIGAQNSAVDVALETFRRGADVTMIVRQSEIGRRVKYWIRPDIVNRIEEGSIKAYFNAWVRAITAHSLVFEDPQGTHEIENDQVLAMTGYLPDHALLASMGIHFSTDERREPVYNSATMETNVRGLYLAGVVCGGNITHQLMIENSRIHASLIIQDLITKKLTPEKPSKT